MNKLFILIVFLFLSVYLMSAFHVTQSPVIPSFGEALESTHDSPTTINVATGGTYVGWISASSGIVSGADLITFADNGTADRLVIGTRGAGTYKVGIHTSLTGSVGTVFVAMFKNGVIDPNMRMDRTISSAIDEGSMSINGIVSLDANDYVDVRVTTAADTKVVNIHVLKFNLTRLER